MREKVSVIIPAFNRSLVLKRAVESVLSQTYKNFELIIIDDGSTDDTPETVSAFGNGIIYKKQENRGPAAARNLGIKTAGADLVAFLDSDDWWDKEKLVVQISAMEKNPSYLISHTQEIWYKNGRVLGQKEKHKKCHGLIFERCLELCAVSMSTAIVRRELFDKAGLFDEDFPCCEDYDFWLRVSVKHPFLLVDKPLTLKEGGETDQVSYLYRTGMDKYRIRAIIKILEKPEDMAKKQLRSARRELVKKCRIYGGGCLKHGKKEEGNRYLNLPAKYGA